MLTLIIFLLIFVGLAQFFARHVWKANLGKSFRDMRRSGRDLKAAQRRLANVRAGRKPDDDG